MSRLFGLATALLLLALAAFWPSNDPETAPWTTEAYVWQSRQREETRQAIARAAPLLDAIHGLAAEVSWKNDQLVVVTQSPLPGGPKSGAVLRLGHSTSGLVWSGDRLAVLAPLVADLAAAGPSEIQVDYDCPTRRLEEYRELLGHLRHAAGDTRLVFTALPDWLDAPAFAALAGGFPGFVLQVHALELPASPGEPLVLCDPAAARRAVARASEFGVAFRVALPTYGSEMVFSADGKRSDVVSEDIGASPGWPVASRARVMADAPAMAALVADWRAARPPGLTGVIWYRLPVDTDQRNWTWETFSAVLSGQPVAPRLVIHLKGTGDGPRDVVLANSGNAHAPMPDRIALPEGILAADASRPYRFETRPAPALVRDPTDNFWPWLAPGATRVIGWLRHPAPPAHLDPPSIP